jgi:ADP-ribose pyrophosphatase YjhB (NUDIX family)
MEIKTSSEFPDGRKYDLYYSDGYMDQSIKIDGVRALCYFEEKLVIVNNKDLSWEPPGGRVEDGEHYIDACKREVAEESNMEVINYQNIGYQDVHNLTKNTKYRLAFLFCIVKPYGEFKSDPDNDITEIKIIDPNEYKKYFSYGELTEYLIPKTLKMLKKYKN